MSLATASLRPVPNRTLVSSAVLVSVMLAPSVFGSPVRFDNPVGPGHFNWSVGSASVRDLDITLNAAAQTGIFKVSPTHFTQQVEAAGNAYVLNLAGSTLQVGGPGDMFLVGVNAGDTIPSGGPWATIGTSYYPDYGSLLPSGTPTYLGVRFDLGGGLQYGWIGVVRSGNSLDAFAWGYETEVGVPIAAGAGPPLLQGACCMPSGSCAIETEADCLAADGIYQGNDTNCETANCPQPCPADIDNNGAVDVDDLIAVILGWGNCLPPKEGPCDADVDDSGVVDVDDLIAVILAWGDCP